MNPILPWATEAATSPASRQGTSHSRCQPGVACPPGGTVTGQQCHPSSRKRYLSSPFHFHQQMAVQARRVPTSCLLVAHANSSISQIAALRHPAVSGRMAGCREMEKPSETRSNDATDRQNWFKTRDAKCLRLWSHIKRQREGKVSFLNYQLKIHHDDSSF